VSPKLNPGGGEGIDSASLQGFAPILRIVCSLIAHRTQGFSSL